MFCTDSCALLKYTEGHLNDSAAPIARHDPADPLEARRAAAAAAVPPAPSSASHAAQSILWQCIAPPPAPPPCRPLPTARALVSSTLRRRAWPRVARLKRPACARDAARAVDWALPDLAPRGGLEWTIGLHADKAADLSNLFGGAADALQVSGRGSPRPPPGPARAVFPTGQLAEG